MQTVDSLTSYDLYLQNLTKYQAISCSVTSSTYGDLVTNKAIEDGATGTNLISRSKKFFNFLNDCYTHYKESKDYSLYMFDIDHDKDSPENFKLSTPEAIMKMLLIVAPILKDVGILIRPSSSSGVKNTETGEYRNSSKSFHVYLLVANSTTKHIGNFTEYLKRRCWITNYAYVSTNGTGVVVKYIFDFQVSESSRLLFEASPIVYEPYIREFEKSTLYNGGILNLEAINCEDEPDYRESVEAQKRVLKGDISPSSSAKTTKIREKSLLNTLPVHDNKNRIIISDDTLNNIASLYNYFQDTKYPRVENIKKFITKQLIKAILTFMGYKVESNYMFKMRDGEKTSSASIRDDGYIKDFGSDFGGGIINFIMEVASIDFITAWKYFQNIFGKSYPIKSKTGALPNSSDFEKCLQTASLPIF